jgi:hypothetical protein
VVVAAKHEIDPHRRVVHDYREVVGGAAVRPQKDGVGHLGEGNRHVAVQPVVEPNRRVPRGVTRPNPETNGRQLAGRLTRGRIIGSQRAARITMTGGGAGVMVRHVPLDGIAGRRTEAPEGLTSREQPAGGVGVDRTALRLAIWGECAAGVRTFVPIQPNHRRSRKIAASEPACSRSVSVSSMRRMDAPPPERATSQLNSAVRAFPR